MKLAVDSGAAVSSSSMRMSPALVFNRTFLGISLLQRCELDDHRRDRYVLVPARRLGGNGADLFDDVHALDDLAEHGVTFAVACVGLVEHRVVGDVDEKLRSRRVG